MKTCPFCAEQIQDEAIKCRYCGSMLVPEGPGTVGSVPGPAPAETDQPMQYTHSGRRYLLGYGRDFFGIWDRQDPSRPVSRYPRTDDGWRSAWIAFEAWEPHNVEVGIVASRKPAGAGTAPSAAWGATPAQARPVSGAWWLLPIFMGWLGGLIAWLVNKEADPQRARAMLFTGIGISVALFLIVLALAGSTST